MPKHSWTIAAELRRLSSEHVTSDAIFALGLADRESKTHRLKEVAAWQRSGSETYSYVFDVCKTKTKRRYILKALVAATPGTPPGRQVKNWIARRKRLDTFGVRTPRLFAAKNGVLLEEFIEADAIDYLRTLARANALSSAIQDSLERICKLVYRAGFAPVAIIPNLRTTGEEFVWVDFGADLGDHYSAASVKQSPARIIARELEQYVWSAVRQEKHH